MIKQQKKIRQGTKQEERLTDGAKGWLIVSQWMVNTGNYQTKDGEMTQKLGNTIVQQWTHMVM